MYITVNIIYLSVQKDKNYDSFHAYAVIRCLVHNMYFNFSVGWLEFSQGLSCSWDLPTDSEATNLEFLWFFFQDVCLIWILSKIDISNAQFIKYFNLIVPNFSLMYNVLRWTFLVKVALIPNFASKRGHSKLWNECRLQALCNLGLKCVQPKSLIWNWHQKYPLKFLKTKILKMLQRIFWSKVGHT